MTSWPGIITDTSPRTARFMPPARCLTACPALWIEVAVDADDAEIVAARRYMWLTRNPSTNAIEVIA